MNIVSFASEWVRNPNITLLRMADRDCLLMRFGCNINGHGIIYCAHAIEMSTLMLGKQQTIELIEMVIMDQVFNYLYKEHGNGD